MFQWTLDNLVGAVEYIRGRELQDKDYRLSIKDLYEETGLAYNLLQRLSKGHKTMVYTSAVEILISWATHETHGVPFGIDDLIVVEPEPWVGPVHNIKEHSKTNGPRIIERPEGSGTRSQDWVRKRKSEANHKYNLSAHFRATQAAEE